MVCEGQQEGKHVCCLCISVRRRYPRRQHSLRTLNSDMTHCLPSLAYIIIFLLQPDQLITQVESDVVAD